MDLLTRVRHALRRAHLVEVGHTLVKEMRLDREDLQLLRVPVDVLDSFPHWRAGSRDGFTPRRLGLTLIPELPRQALRAIRLQLSTAVVEFPIGLTLLSTLGRQLDATTRIVVLVDPDADLHAMRRAARSALGQRKRVRFVHAAFSTIFARDTALAAVDARGRPVLLVPREVRDPIGGDEQPLDGRVVRHALGIRVVSSRFHWKGGNILFDGESLAIGADAIAENMARLGLTADEVTRGLAAEFGMDLTVLGDPAAGRLDEDRASMARSGQASYHIDLDVALLGSNHRSDAPVALVADGQLGLELLPAVMAGNDLPLPRYLPASRGRELLMHEYRAATKLRAPLLRAYCDTLNRRGYRIVRVPELRTRELHGDVTGVQNVIYCNVVPGLHRRRAAVHYLPWGIAAMDSAAERAYVEAGAKPVRLAGTAYLATAMMERAAGLRCFCGGMP